jgi:hypothetical protein
LLQAVSYSYKKVKAGHGKATFSNFWGLYFKEWKGSQKTTLNIMIAGIIVVILSTMVVGYGNYLGGLGM